ncbi:MAG TPA: NAD(P)-dependent oxidoreductase [Verrucomicrobiae bacterium]|nr:NAD(P)-dependent oxidoreductase [Verrucomicrobiae bacterium]
MNDSEVLIIGAYGQLGLALQAKYPGARAVDSDVLDITDREAVRRFNWSGLTTIINAAAFTNVDGAETREGRVIAWKVNATGVRNLSEIALQHDLTFIHISSDYVFDGISNNHTEDEPFSPLSVYGETKAAGDLATSFVPKHYLLRAAWVIGEGKNFVRTMLSLGEKGVAPTVVADQVGRLTFTSELVRIIDHVLTTKAAYGTYNATNDGEPASWANITRKIFQFGGYDLAVTDTTTAEYFAGKDDIAPRPLNSIMSLDKLHSIGFSSRDWQDVLKDYVTKEQAK